MSILNWFNRKYRLARRKEKLGERYTSDLTTRKFTTEDLRNLNCDINFSEIKHIYQIGWCGGEDRYLNEIKGLIHSSKLNTIFDLKGITYETDELGEVPVGNYIQTYLFELDNGITFVELVAGSFDYKGKEIVFKKEVEKVNVNTINNRILIYPI